MRLFRVTLVNNDVTEQIGARNEVQLNAYNLLVHTNTDGVKKASINGCAEPRKISFAQLTR